MSQAALSYQLDSLKLEMETFATNITKKMEIVEIELKNVDTSLLRRN